MTRSWCWAIRGRDVNAARNIRAAARRTLSGSPGGGASECSGFSVFSVVPAGAGPWRAGAVSRFGEADRMRRDRRQRPRHGGRKQDNESPRRAYCLPRASRPGRHGNLGHSAIALTMNTYSHVAPEVSREPLSAWPGCSGMTRPRTRRTTTTATGGMANGRRCCLPHRWR